jgi:deazaflavin-dependent oxidoreductase (nitroreductase family)
VPIPKAVARFNRYVTNPVARLVAGWLPPFAVILHRGRTSGREYRTPVWAFRADQGFVIALTYGADSDWVRNVTRAGGCTLLRGGRSLEAVDPRLRAGPEAMTLVPRLVRWALRMLRVTELLHISATPDG